jgi:CRP/FNR family transcriptional regulator
MRKVCIPSCLDGADIVKFASIVHTKRRLQAGQRLYRAGETSRSLYAIRSGFVKALNTTDDGREQVTGFHMMGELIGMDALGEERHADEVVALESTEVCEIPVAELEKLSHEMPPLRRKLYQMVGLEIQQKREAMLLLGAMRAEERLASFLLNLGRRYEERGFSASRFVLRMTRADIGRYLGLRLETVSRLLSKFQMEDLLGVRGKSVEIRSRDGLRLVLGSRPN